MRSHLVLLGAALLCSAPPALAQSGVITEPISFRVTNPLEPLFPRTVRGTLYLPANAPRCAQTVVLLMHGLSYGAWAWDFPLQPGTYSMARVLAANGYPAVAVDELGYGTSDHPNGQTLTVQSYGELTAQMVSALHTARYSAAGAVAYQKVVLFGHSAGSEMSELAAGQHGGVDGLIAGAYSHFPSAGILLSVLTQDSVQAALHPYIYFDGTPDQRARDMFNLAVADPAVVDQDTSKANLTPSGEILTIGNQPSRAVLPLITAPTLLLFAENDDLFPPSVAGVDFATAELALFVAAMDRSVQVVPEDGHTFMLHPNGPQTQQRVLEWLGPRFPACAN